MRRTESHIKEAEDLDAQVLDSLYNSAKSILNTCEKNELSAVLFTSINDAEGTLTAAAHIGYILTQLKKKVLVINMDLNNPGEPGKYFERNHDETLNDVVTKSSYLSEAIQQTQYENYDTINIGKIDEQHFLEILNTKDIKSKLNPLKNYYDAILIIGPEAKNFEHYSNIFELADGTVTVSRDKTSNYKDLKRHIDKLGLFNIVSFGIIRNSK